MRINNRLYLSLVFYIAGTAILVLLLTTVGINFAADSSLFEEPLLVAEGDGGTVDAGNGQTNGNGSVDGTLYYNRKVSNSNSGGQAAAASTAKSSASVSAKPSGSLSRTGTPVKTAAASSKVTTTPAMATNGNGGGEPGIGNGDNGTIPGNGSYNLNVEIINYSGVNEVADEIRALLTAAGYSATIRIEDFTAVIGTTTIIDRSSTGIGEKIRDVIMAGRIEKGNGSREYIATIMIGQDLIP